MKRIIRLTESDLTRIVRRVLNEQGGADWDSYVQTYLNGNKPGTFLSTYSNVEAEDAKEGRNYIGFQVTRTGINGVSGRDNNQYYYQCVADEGFQAGVVYDSDGTLKPDILAELKKGGSPFMNFFNAGCKLAYAEKARKAKEAEQVAGQKASAQKGAEKAAVQKQVQNAIAKGYIKKTVGQDGVAKYSSLGKGPFTIGMFQHNLPKGTDMTQDINDALK